LANPAFRFLVLCNYFQPRAVKTALGKTAFEEGLVRMD